MSEKLRVGDLVCLRADVLSTIGPDLQNLGLITAISDDTIPRTVSVLWQGLKEPHEEYEDGLVTVRSS